MTSDNTIDYSLLNKTKPMRILVVDDELISIEFLKAHVTELGHTMRVAKNGKDALNVLEADPDSIDVVLMDRQMPVMDGLTAVKKMKGKKALRNIPVIMVTGADSVDEMREGLDAGVFYYLTKPVQPDMLRSVLSAAVREAEQERILADELGKHKTSFDLIDTAKFKLRTIAEAESLSAFIANCFPEPERVLSGLAELLINAIEHGNLDLGYDAKTQLIETGTWRSEIERLQTLPQHSNKYVTATIAHKNDGTYVVIEDEGNGFEWQKYMKIDPARAGDNHGRGIAQANTVNFDKLTYNQSGNQVVVFVGKEKQLDW